MDKTFENSSIYSGFVDPPKGYGNVPFYWWNGDTLDTERIDKQLRMLAEGGVSGVQINFCHYCPEHDPDKTGGGFGKTYVSDPPMFTDKWWDIVNHTFHTAKSLGLGVGISDYTLGWIGNGFFVDSVVYDAGLCATELRFKRVPLRRGDVLPKPENGSLERILLADGRTDVSSADDSSCEIPPSGLPVASDRDTADFRVPCNCFLAEVYTEVNRDSIDVTDPRAGRLLCKLFYEDFLSHLDEDVRDVLNYCFQDEFISGCDFSKIWSDRLESEFLAKKGYDIIPHLHELFTDECGKQNAAKIRLDYADVRTSLVEKGYFEPIYEFHRSRGLIYGCDQCSRGYNPAEYGDYFRALKYFTAPGNDTPDRYADLIKVKVSSSAAHLYGHKRVWLEGYHSSGWGTSLASLSAPTSENFIYGANLLCMHGLYYSTYGGFWEWAPPDFHFRMPYWKHAKTWFGYYERLSYILSEGTHRCDAAVYYPVSAYDVGFDSERAGEYTFACAHALRDAGIDFDFIDFESIGLGRVNGGKFCVAGEEYKALIFCGTDSLRAETARSAAEFAENGGTVIFIGDIPEFFDVGSADEAQALAERLKAASENVSAVSAGSITSDVVSGMFRKCGIFRDFEASKNAFALHRSMPEGDIFFVRGEKGERCSFGASGYCELWNPADGSRTEYSHVEKDGRTELILPNDGDNLFFFAKTDSLLPPYIPEGKTERRIALDTDWELSLEPTLDNRFGDFRMPPESDCRYIGAEIRRADIDGKSCKFGVYTPFEKISADGTSVPEVYDRHGLITGSISEQGYHGLKKCVYNFNMELSEQKTKFRTYAFADSDKTVCFEFYGIMPEYVLLDGNMLDLGGGPFELTFGEHLFELFYGEAKESARCGAFLRTADDSEGNAYTFAAFESMEAAAVKKSRSGIPLTNDWFAAENAVRLSAEHYREEKCVSFEAAPGTVSLTVICFGKVESAYSDTEKFFVSYDGKRSYGANTYRVKLPEGQNAHSVRLAVKPFSGYTDGDIFPEPIMQTVGTALVNAGDLSLLPGLECYSGSMIYRRELEVESGDLSDSKRIILDLGKVGCTCGISVGGISAYTLCSAPYRADITDYLKAGTNSLVIDVRNTLCNHYSTSPSLYSGWPDDRASGLLGPVCLEITKSE